MASIVEHTKKLITELKRIQTPGAFPEKIDGEPVFPGFISAGEAGSINMSREMERLVKIIASDLKNSDPVLCRTHTDKEWNWIVRGAFGIPLAGVDLGADLDLSAQAVVDHVRSTLSSPRPVFGVQEHAFGCTLFGNVDMPGFDIGPVRFEPRLDWLNRKAADRLRSRISRRATSHPWRTPLMPPPSVGTTPKASAAHS